MVQHLNQRLAEVRAEESRAFDEYSFLNVASRPLLKGTAVTTSPLSSYPPKALARAAGYFQLNPDGSLHSPVLPGWRKRSLTATSSSSVLGLTNLPDGWLYDAI